MAGFDFSALDTVTVSEAGRRIVLVHTATKEPLVTPDGGAVSVTVAGPDSARHRRAQVAARRRVAIWAEANKSATPDDIAEFDHQNTVRFISDLVIAWEGVAFKGVELDATPENAFTVISAVPDITKQIDMATGGGDRSRFLAE